jgi:ESCRT-I complex subunit VPS28
MDDDVKLFTNNRGREKYENLADLYSILVATEHLERAYIRDSISSQEYASIALTFNVIGDSNSYH